MCWSCSLGVLLNRRAAQAIESIEEEEYGAGGGGLADADEAPPLSLRRQIAVYEGARALIGSITPHFDEVAKVRASSSFPDSHTTWLIPDLNVADQSTAEFELCLFSNIIALGIASGFSVSSPRSRLHGVCFPSFRIDC